MLREHPAAAAYYLRVLAIAEQYRGNYHESLSRTKDKAKRLAEGLVMLERELDSIGSLPHGREAGFRASLDSLKKTAEDCLK